MAYRQLLNQSQLSNRLKTAALRTSSSKLKAHSSGLGQYNFNNLDACRGFETKVPVNSPVNMMSLAVPENSASQPNDADPRNLTKPGDMDIADKVDPTESLSKVPIFGQKSSRLRRLVSDYRSRPTTAHPSKRIGIRPSEEIRTSGVPPQSSSLPQNVLDHSFGNKVRSERPKGAHHRNHPMLIPGIAELETDDELDSSASSSEQFSSSAEPTAPGPHFLTERPPNNPRLTFVPGKFCGYF